MGVKKAKIIPVIQIATRCGTGTEEDPIRDAMEYWDTNGNLLCVVDAKKEIKVNYVHK